MSMLNASQTIKLNDDEKCFFSSVFNLSGLFFHSMRRADTIINEYNEYNEYSRPMEFGETIYNLKSDTVYHSN